MTPLDLLLGIWVKAEDHGRRFTLIAVVAYPIGYVIAALGGGL